MKKALLLFVIASTVTAGIGQNVGIGTTAPGSKLQVNYNSADVTVANGFHLVDSGINQYNKIRLSKSGQTTGMNIGLFSISNTNASKYLDIFSDSVTTATFQGNGRVGIKNLYPGYTLDVGGDINTSGALRVNGSAGTTGQVLLSNGDGTMVWNDVCSYKNMATYNSGSGSFTVPADVTKVWVEAWGGGGGGSWYAGGGGGGYVSAYFSVSAATTISYSIGTGGSGGGASSPGGNTTTVSYTPSSITLTANGGTGSSITGSFVSAGGGGAAFASGTTAFVTLFGESGESTRSRSVQTGATTFYEEITGGAGGNAANTHLTGGRGTHMLITMAGSSVTRAALSDGGNVPGGGGGSGYVALLNTSGASASGGPGGLGRVIIHY